MVGTYVVLSEQQTDWMRRVVKNMIELTGYYSFLKQPLKETDYENIAGVFSNYTRKSHGNEMIVKWSVTLTAYLDGLEKSKISRLDQEQMQSLAEVADELFDITRAGNGMPVGDIFYRIDRCCGELQNHMLLDDIKGIFKEYAVFCAAKSSVGFLNNVQDGQEDTRQRASKSR